MDAFTFAGLTLALAAGGLAKGATGMGLPLVGLPVLTPLVGLQQAIGIMLTPMLLTNAWQVWRLRAVRRDTGLAFLPRFLVAGAVGVALGTWALGALPERSRVFGLGVILLAYVALRLAQPQVEVGEATAGRLGPSVGLAAGALQGATGISAPIGVTFIHAMRLDRSEHVFAVSAMFLGFSLVQLPAVAVAGIFEPAWLAQGVFAMLPVMVGMPLGERLGRRFSRETFDRLILIFLAVMGVKLTLGL
jgi:uncharacterized membrane protein YfcA